MLIIVLAAGMIFLLTGCGKEEQKVNENNAVKVQEQTNSTNEVEEKESLEISMGQWKDNVYSNESIGMKFKLAVLSRQALQGGLLLQQFRNRP